MPVLGSLRHNVSGSGTCEINKWHKTNSVDTQTGHQDTSNVTNLNRLLNHMISEIGRAKETELGALFQLWFVGWQALGKPKCPYVHKK